MASEDSEIYRTNYSNQNLEHNIHIAWVFRTLNHEIWKNTTVTWELLHKAQDTMILRVSALAFIQIVIPNISRLPEIKTLYKNILDFSSYQQLGYKIIVNPDNIIICCRCLIQLFTNITERGISDLT